MDVLAAARLELRRRAAPRSRAGWCVLDRRRRRHGGGAGVPREHERPAHGLPFRRRRVRAHRLRPALPAVRPLLQAVDAHPDPAAALGRAASAGALPADVRVRARRDRPLARVEPHRVHGLPDARPPDDERAAHLRRGRAAVPARTRPPSRAHLGRAARGGPRGDGGALPRADPRLLAPVGEGHARAARLPARGRPLGARAQAPPVRGHGSAARRDDDEHPRAPRLGPHVGLPLLLAARRLLHAERARTARALGGDGDLPGVPPQPLRAARRRAPARIPDQRRLRRGGARARAPLRLQRRRPGAHRQSGVRARPERRLRRDGARR